jgi:hypothetical protein
MNRIEIQRALYNARNNYLKAKKETGFWAREISILKDMGKALDMPDLFIELFGELK